MRGWLTGPRRRTWSRRRWPGCSERERRLLLAHEVSGQGTRSLAQEVGSTAGAVAAQLNRARARLRVQYLLVLERAEPATNQCRPVLLALSSGDRRRQREVDADRHLLECDLCAELSQPLLERGQQRDDQVRIPICTDADIVAARQGVRETAGRLGFSRTDLTLIATAVSEVARNIVRFAGSGGIVIERSEPGGIQRWTEPPDRDGGAGSRAARAAGSAAGKRPAEKRWPESPSIPADREQAVDADTAVPPGTRWRRL